MSAVGPLRTPSPVPGPAGWEPAYSALCRTGELARRVDRALESLRSCRVCPRNCDVDRLADRYAFCKTGRFAAVSSHFPHFGEEDCLRGWNGSGTIFFSHCSAVAWHPTLQSEQVSLLVLDVVDQVPGDRARGTVQPVRFGFSCFNDVYNFAAAAGGQVIRDQGAMAPP